MKVFINLAHGLQKNNNKNRKIGVLSLVVTLDMIYSIITCHLETVDLTQEALYWSSLVWLATWMLHFFHMIHLLNRRPALVHTWNQDDALTPQIKISASEKQDSSRGISMRDFLNELLTSSVSIISYFPEGKNDVWWVVIGKHAICILITLHMVLIQV